MKENREPLSKERIVDEALRVADERGVDALSMRKVAAELGVQAMSLYNHVAGKDAILNELVERVVAEIEVPSLDDEWKTAMRRRAHSAHAVLLRHPWAILVIMTRVTAGPYMLRYVNATIGCLVKAGFSYELADHIWHTMDNHIYGFTLQEANFPFDAPDFADTARGFLPQIVADEYPYFTELATLIVERRYNGVHEFDFGLDLILDGLEKHLPGEHRRAARV